MTKDQIAELFKSQKECYLVRVVGGMYMPLARGPFQAMLTGMYLSVPMNEYRVGLPDGSTYPNYQMEEKNERN